MGCYIMKLPNKYQEGNMKKHLIATKCGCLIFKGGGCGYGHG